MTSISLILERLSVADKPLAVHELRIEGYSENNLATRLSELARCGEVVGRVRPGKRFKEWALARRFEANGQGVML